MKFLLSSILIVFLLSCCQESSLDGTEILNNAIAAHDPQNSWDKTVLHIHIQEPRLSNPHRYSILKLDNANNTFNLTRNRDQHVSEHLIDSDGNSTVLLDGEAEIDTALVKKYRLDPSRNPGYQRFYYMMYGLPMSLNNSIHKVVARSEALFNNKLCYKIEVELKEAMISRYWQIYIGKSSSKIAGVEIVFPDKPSEGERLIFEQIIEINGINIPQIRHWHELDDNEYSGSDLIINEIDN